LIIDHQLKALLCKYSIDQVITTSSSSFLEFGLVT
jgi:hypothetical protein